MKFLLVWELGANFGHIFRLRLIARELRTRGHVVAFFLGDTETGAQVLAAEGFVVCPSPPLTLSMRHAHRDLGSYGDILASKGFGRRDVIEPVIDAWQAIFASEQPDVVILDHSPAALIAARLARIPTLNVAASFEIPPHLSPYPSFLPQGRARHAALLETEHHILATLNVIATARGARQSDHLSACLLADQEILLTFPEFDHYPERRNGHYLGPLFDIEHGIEVSWPATALPNNVFAYLRPDKVTPVLLDKLQALQANVICVIPGLSAELQQRYASERFQIHTEALRLDRLLSTCDLVVCHTSHGLVLACICLGVPVLGIPTQMEQYMLSRRLAVAGNGLFLARRDVHAKMASALAALLTDPRYLAKARALATKYGAHDRHQVLGTLADMAERLAR